MKTIYNIDLFGARFGKKLPKYQKNINKTINTILHYLTIIGLIGGIVLIFFLWVKLTIIIINY